LRDVAVEEQYWSMKRLAMVLTMVGAPKSGKCHRQRTPPRNLNPGWTLLKPSTLHLIPTLEINLRLFTTAFAYGLENLLSALVA
jgi:hypothetical protein